LVLRAARAAADPDVLNRLQEQAGARFMRQFAAQPRNHLVGRYLADRQWLERNEHRPGVTLTATREAYDRSHRGILLHDGNEVCKLRPHCLEGDALVGLNRARDAARVLLWEKSFRDGDVQIDGQGDSHAQEQQHRQPVIQGPVEGAFISRLQRVEGPFAQTIQPAVYRLLVAKP
jgi:hypothetical protein